MTIARGRFSRPERTSGKRLRTNDRIRISPVRLIDENDKQVGVIDLEEAKTCARQAQLDLVEVAPQSSPPVCRIMDYGKWMYQQKKKEHKSSAQAHKSELKGMRLRPKIDKHDLDIKVSKARQFLEESHKVQFTMLFRGREMAHRNLGMNVMNSVCDTLETLSKVEAPPRMMGRRMTMVLAPDRTGLGKSSHIQKENAKPLRPTPGPPAKTPQTAGSTATTG